MVTRNRWQTILAYAAAAALAVATSPAWANPPPPDSQAAERLIPYSEAIKHLVAPNTGRSCCDLSDCRMVDLRVGRNGHYEALIAPYNPATGDGFPGGPGKYLEVPPEVILAPDKRNGVPFALACWATWSHRTNGFLCLSPGPDS